MNKINKIIRLGVITLLVGNITACAYGKFGAISDRYGLFGSTPKEFTDQAPEHIGKYDFIGFGKSYDNGSTTYQAYYFNPTPSGNKSDGGLIIDIYAFNSSPLTTKNGMSWLSQTSQVYLNCKEKTFGELSISYFSTKDVKSKKVYNEDYSKDFKPQPVNPSRLDRTLYTKVCNQGL